MCLEIWFSSNHGSGLKISQKKVKITAREEYKNNRCHRVIMVVSSCKREPAWLTVIFKSNFFSKLGQLIYPNWYLSLHIKILITNYSYVRDLSITHLEDTVGDKFALFGNLRRHFATWKLSLIITQNFCGRKNTKFITTGFTEIFHSKFVWNTREVCRSSSPCTVAWRGFLFRREKLPA